jgi:uncharacterized protein YciI
MRFSEDVNQGGCERRQCSGAKRSQRGGMITAEARFPAACSPLTSEEKHLWRRTALIGLCALLFSTETLTQEQTPPNAPSGGFFLVLLKRPAKAPQITPEAGAKLEAAYTANIQKMFAERKLAMAGPLLDQRPLNAILVFQTDSMAQAREWTDSNPKVEAGQLTAEVHGPWLIDASAIRHPALPKAVDEYTLVLMKRNELSPAAADLSEIVQRYLSFMHSMTNAGKLAVAGLIESTDPGELRGAAIYRVDAKQTGELEQSDPLFKDAIVTIELHPCVAARGVLAPGQPPQVQ